jgi:hypothetical protein
LRRFEDKLHAALVHATNKLIFDSVAVSVLAACSAYKDKPAATTSITIDDYKNTIIPVTKI